MASWSGRARLEAGKKAESVIKVAVTGGAATGKSTVCQVFEELGAYTVNLDMLARKAAKPGSALVKKIAQRLGPEVIYPDGKVDRKKIRQIIVRDPAARQALEAITHPEIFRRMEKALHDIALKDRDAVVAVEIPLLIEVGAQDRFDVVVLIEADSETQKRRLMARDGVSAWEAEGFLGLQMPAEKKRARADYIVSNNGSIQDIRPRVADIYGQIAQHGSAFAEDHG